jgi:hypothetical protein
MKTSIIAHQTVEAKIIKKDGTIENLGIISEYKAKQNIFRRIWKWLIN